METDMNYNRLTIAFTALLMLAISSIQAQARPDSRSMTCASARALIQSYGAVIMSTGNHTYDKYVKNHAYCNLDEGTKNGYAPTLDNRRCKVGFVCFDRTIFLD